MSPIVKFMLWNSLYNLEVNPKKTTWLLALWPEYSCIFHCSSDNHPSINSLLRKPYQRLWSSSFSSRDHSLKSWTTFLYFINWTSNSTFCIMYFPLECIYMYSNFLLQFCLRALRWYQDNSKSHRLIMPAFCTNPQSQGATRSWPCHGLEELSQQK